MRRRAFIAMLGGVAAWPLSVGAQQLTIRSIGFLSGTSRQPLTDALAAFDRGLSETGYADGRDVVIEYRWGDGDYDRVPTLAADLVHRRTALIVATGSMRVPLAAKAATTTIPIVFVSGGDPIKAGLVTSLNRPEGNVTGVTMMFSALLQKRLELLHQLIPTATAIGVLVNPNYPDADLQARDAETAAVTLSQKIHLVSAGTQAAIDVAFSILAERNVQALLLANDPFFESRRNQIVALAARHNLPAIYQDRAFVTEGGLMSYGASLTEAFRQVGVYSGRILGGAKPNDLPVLQPRTFEIVINLKTARQLGLDIPPTLLARADEVIE